MITSCTRRESEAYTPNENSMRRKHVMQLQSCTPVSTADGTGHHIPRSDRIFIVRQHGGFECHITCQLTEIQVRYYRPALPFASGENDRQWCTTLLQVLHLQKRPRLSTQAKRKCTTRLGMTPAEVMGTIQVGTRNLSQTAQAQHERWLQLPLTCKA